MSKTLIQETIKTPEDRRLFAQEGFVLAITESVCELMELQGVSKKELAKKLGTNQSHVTMLLNGTRELSLRTLADIIFYLDADSEVGIELKKAKGKK